MLKPNKAEGMPVPDAPEESVLSTQPPKPIPFNLYQPGSEVPDYKRLNNLFWASFPNKVEICDTMTLACACQGSDTHHGRFKDGKTAKGVFLKAHVSQSDFMDCDCIIIDIDNTPNTKGVDDISPSDWITPQKFKENFGSIEFYIVPSKSNQIQKERYSPRPRFHVFMPTNKIIDYTELSRRYKQLAIIMPFMDPAYLCCVQKTGGNKNLKPSEVIYNPGISVLDYLDGLEELKSELKDIRGEIQPQTDTLIDVSTSDISFDFNFDIEGAIRGEFIRRGSRINTLKKGFANIVFKYGDTQRAHELAQELINKCEPDPTSSAQNKFLDTAKSLFSWFLETNKQKTLSLIPEDFTEMGQAKMFVKTYGSIVRFVSVLGWHWYNGIRWVNQDAEHKTINLIKELTDKQGNELTTYLQTKELSEDERERQKEYAKHIKNMRSNKAIQNVLKLCESYLLLPVDSLDHDPYILNTPSCVIDLRTATKRDHSPNDFCTQTTSFDPISTDTEEGKEQDLFWCNFLDVITNKDKDFQHYLQLVLGSYIIGRIENMTMLNCYGVAGSGKSTFINSIVQVVGDYAGSIPSEFFTTSVDDKSARNMLAVNRGKRLIVSNEISKGQSFGQARMKHFVDNAQRVEIEEKFKQPILIKATANFILVTNDLLNVRDDTDVGFWDRLIIAPLNQRMRNTPSEIKDYQTILVNKSGRAILRWLIGGAKEFLECDSKIKHVPECCTDALESYQSESDWIQYFLAECCEIEGENETGYKVGMSALYERYTIWNKKSEERLRAYNRKDFKNSLINYSKVNITYRLGTGGSYYFYGIRLKTDF